ncbi:16905_t:CDS:2 [Funneliformis mosseae]|uniref:16905_t:CDS:1 n=1 Tax=Funneliformis mosseae TaxID=27381 RepID=A0A9N9DAK5_FUNMO|nr:16905_t:CDS:2 [Funneliformis mosseae]
MKNLVEDELVVDLTDNNNALVSIKDDNNALINAKDDNNVLVGTKGNNNALVSTKDNNNTFADVRDDSSASIKDDDLLAKGDSETGILNNWDVEINSLNLMEISCQELEESVDNDIQNNNDCDFNQKLQKLEQIILNNNKKQNVYDYLRYQYIHAYFTYWKKDGLTQMKASEKVLEEIYSKGIYRSRVICKLGDYWIKYNTLPISLQGHHQKIKSFIDDEDIINYSLIYIHFNSRRIIPQQYREFIISKLFPQMGIIRSILIKTARIWLHKLV